MPRLTKYWVAKILEIRAADEHHVYARIYWMYSPDELPPNTRYGEESIEGRQTYHGENELIASNHSMYMQGCFITPGHRANYLQWMLSTSSALSQKPKSINGSNQTMMKLAMLYTGGKHSILRRFNCLYVDIKISLLPPLRT